VITGRRISVGLASELLANHGFMVVGDDVDAADIGVASIVD
jgi:hypothetical protein